MNGLILWAQLPQSIFDEPWRVAGGLVATLLFGLLGIALAIFGFKLFDMVTPGKLEVEIVEKQNLAAAILGAAIIIGICMIVSHSM